jgi:hypothetical protein
VEEKMKVFISWSGTRSRRVAAVLAQWLSGVIQAVKPYYSPDDVAKGVRWNSEIAKELEAATLGVLCLTSDNLESPWMMFEAGALSKNLDSSRVCPILFGVEPTELKGPLVQFQAAKFEKEEIRRVVKMLNGELGDLALAPDVFESVFEMWWPQLDEKIRQEIEAARAENEVPRRSERDLLEEILTIARSLARDAVPRETSRELITSYREVVEAAVLGDGASLKSALRRMADVLQRLPRPRSLFSFFEFSPDRELRRALRLLEPETTMPEVSGTAVQAPPGAGAPSA